MRSAFDPLCQLAVVLKQYSEETLVSLAELLSQSRQGKPADATVWRQGLRDIQKWGPDIIVEEEQTLRRIAPDIDQLLRDVFANPPPAGVFLFQYLKCLAACSIVRDETYFTRETEDSRFSFHLDIVMAGVIRTLRLAPRRRQGRSPSNPGGDNMSTLSMCRHEGSRAGSAVSRRSQMSAASARRFPSLHAAPIIMEGGGADELMDDVQPDDSVSHVPSRATTVVSTATSRRASANPHKPPPINRPAATSATSAAPANQSGISVALKHSRISSTPIPTDPIAATTTTPPANSHHRGTPSEVEYFVEEDEEGDEVEEGRADDDDDHVSHMPTSFLRIDLEDQQLARPPWMEIDH